jgi:hypothetical protein
VPEPSKNVSRSPRDWSKSTKRVSIVPNNMQVTEEGERKVVRKHSGTRSLLDIEELSKK